MASLPFRGAGGEPVDFGRTILSHGVAELPPNRVDLAERVLETTLPVARGARTVRITERHGKLRIEGSSDRRLTDMVAHMFRLDGSLRVLRARARGRPRVVRARRRPDAACADRVRGRRQDDLNAHTNHPG